MNADGMPTRARGRQSAGGSTDSNANYRSCGVDVTSARVSASSRELAIPEHQLIRYGTIPSRVATPHSDLPVAISRWSVRFRFREEPVLLRSNHLPPTNNHRNPGGIAMRDRGSASMSGICGPDRYEVARLRQLCKSCRLAGPLGFSGLLSFADRQNRRRKCRRCDRNCKSRVPFGR